MLPRIFLAIALLLAFGSRLFAQEKGTPIYLPRAPYTSNELITSLQKRKDAAVKNTKNQKLKNHYILTLRTLKNMADQGLFLHDHETETMINEVLKKVLAANPQLKRQPQQVLIIRSTEADAVCFGEGTIGITTGMLSRIDSEPVLADMLTHEISHYELDHVGQEILDDVEKKTSKKVKQGIQKIDLADELVTTRDIDSLKKWIYGQSHFRRAKEAEADSLGLTLLINAGYYGGTALTSLTLLDSANEPKYHLGDLLHDSFNSTKVPFQDYWMSPRLSLFDNLTFSIFLSDDSLKTHPDLLLRRQKMISSLKSSEELQLGKTSMFWNADLEDIESAIFQNNYDNALLLALTTIPHSPSHAAYLKGIVARILIDVYAVKDTPMMNQYVPIFTSGYSRDRKTVNSFLHNIHKEQLGELAFDYLNRKGNFDTSVEYHYYELWRICNFTGRDELKTRVKKTYRDKFGKGDYYDRMDNQIQIVLPKGPKSTRGY